MKKTVAFLAAVLLVLGMSGCGSPSSKAAEQQTGSSSAVQTSGSSQDGSGSSSDGENDSSSQQTNQAGAPSQATQKTLNQVKSALSTNTPLMLPTDVPVDAGRWLASVTSSQAQSYKATFYETDQSVDVNSQAVSKGTPIVTVEGKKYADAASAAKSISGYQEVKNSGYDGFVDLGHQIKAAQDEGAGQHVLIWNEGNWCLSVEGPSEPEYRNKKYPDSEQLAKDVVSYLENHMLPPPKNIGVIKMYVGDPANSAVASGTNVVWQKNDTVYQVSSADVMTALKVAVAMKFC